MMKLVKVLVKEMNDYGWMKLEVVASMGLFSTYETPSLHGTLIFSKKSCQ